MKLADMTFKTAIVAILIASCQGCGTFPPDPECGFIRNSAGQNVKARLPVYFYIDDSVPLMYREAILDASLDWNDATGRKFFEFAGMVSSESNWQQYDGIRTIYWVTGRYVRSSNEQAFIHSKWYGSIFAESDIWINNVNFTFYTDANPDAGMVHLKSLMLHELGHMIGLAHSPDANSVMFKTLSNRTERPLTETDIKNVECEYGSRR